MSSKSEPWLIYWPSGLDKLLRTQDSGCIIYIVGALLPPSTIFVASFVVASRSTLDSDLITFNAQKSPQEPDINYVVLGQIQYNSIKKIPDNVVEPLSPYWLSVDCFDQGEIYIWPTSKIKSTTLISYTKPKQSYFYFLGAPTAPSSQSSQRTVRDHLKKRDIDSCFVPISRCLQLINFAYDLDHFLKISPLGTSSQEEPLQSLWLGSWKLPETFLRRSSFAQQLQYRLNQLQKFPFHKEQSLLMVIDIMFGWGIGYWILRYRGYLGSQLVAAVDYYSIVLLKSFIDWLMGYPAGLKINIGLANFLGELFMWLIYLWVEWTHSWTEHASIIVGFVGVVSFVSGLTVALALAGDLLSLSTLHLYWFYLVESRIYSWHISLIHSLSRLFRGKKYNVLRCRTDSCDYDVEQLILGTILFTILIFLYPTIIVYYILAASAWVIVVVLQGIIEVALGAMNHFPLYALLRRLSYPASMPNGICLEPKSNILNLSVSNKVSDMSYDFPLMPNKILDFTDPDFKSSTVQFTLKSVPVSFSRLFYNYGVLFRHIVNFYSKTQLIRSLTSGRMVQLLPRFESTESPFLNAKESRES